ncbi:MAG: thiamine ABC transporter substrate binding subunit [Bacteroidota bacterium]
MFRRILPVLLLLSLAAPAVSAAPAPLVVYTYGSFGQELVDDLQGAYAKRIGQPVEVRTFADTGPLFNQLVQEKDAPRADVVVGLDSFDLPKAIRYDLLAPFKPKALAGVDRRFIFDRQYRLLPFDYGYVLFNYDSERLQDVPKSHRDLTLPKYKGKIVIENPKTSSPGRIFLLTTIALFGEDGYLDYWRRLRPNLLTVTPGWDEAYGMYTNGEVPIVLSYGTSPVYHLLYDKTERYKALVLDGRAYAQIEGVGLVKGAAHRPAAERLIEYILSTEFQAKIPTSQFMYPVAKKVALPEAFRVAAKVDRLLHLDEALVAEKLPIWLKAWEQVMTE